MGSRGWWQWRLKSRRTVQRGRWAKWPRGRSGIGDHFGRPVRQSNHNQWMHRNSCSPRKISVKKLWNIWVIYEMNDVIYGWGNDTTYPGNAIRKEARAGGPIFWIHVKQGNQNDAHNDEQGKEDEHIVDGARCLSIYKLPSGNKRLYILQRWWWRHTLRLSRRREATSAMKMTVWRSMKPSRWKPGIRAQSEHGICSWKTLGGAEVAAADPLNKYLT